MQQKKKTIPNIREILRLSKTGHFSNRSIATSVGCSATTVQAVLTRFKNSGISDGTLASMEDAALYSHLYPSLSPHTSRPCPDLEAVHKEMKRKGVTLTQLWQEYIRDNPDGIAYSHFCECYGQFRERNNISMHQEHRAGESIYVDWVGPTMAVANRETGEIQKAYFFVGVLGASNYFYTEAFPSMDLSCWIQAHIHMFGYFKGTADKLIPDNLRTGVAKASYYEPVLNQTYLEMSQYYGIAVLPARVRHPKDKSLAEGTVLLVERWIQAKHRNDMFFSFAQLNNTVFKDLESCNQRPFQKMKGSRYSLYMELEKDTLHPLPDKPYEMAVFKPARVNLDYHVEFEGNYYSVDFRLLKKEVMVRVTANIIEILHDGQRVASHVRILEAGKHRYCTDPVHMPEKHKFQSSWNEERFLHWAQEFGPQTEELVRRIYAGRQVPEQAIRSCLGILNLSKKYGAEKLEGAAGACLKNKQYSYRSMNAQMESMPGQEAAVNHKNIRGEDYYTRLIENGGCETC